MSDPSRLAGRPPAVTGDDQFAGWFARVADRLLNRCDFVVAGESFRLAELEMYYHGPGHPDPFPHRDVVQRLNGRWYFHRTRGAYRGGSFKGLDLTLGDGTARFGVLFRTVVAPGGEVIDGPSLTVDRLLAATGYATVAELDDAIGTRTAWDATSPLSIRASGSPRADVVYRTARVGLSLKRGARSPEAARYVMRPYRSLTEPRAIGKGRPQLVLALHEQGRPPDAIQAVTGVPRRTVAKYLAEYEAGKRSPGFDAYYGNDLGPADVCRLLGTWAAKYGRQK